MILGRNLRIYVHHLSGLQMSMPRQINIIDRVIVYDRCSWSSSRRGYREILNDFTTSRTLIRVLLPRRACSYLCGTLPT